MSRCPSCNQFTNDYDQCIWGCDDEATGLTLHLRYSSRHRHWRLVGIWNEGQKDHDYAVSVPMTAPQATFALRVARLCLGTRRGEEQLFCAITEGR